MATRPAAMSSSQCLREPSPAAARNRFRRTFLPAGGLNVRLRFGKADHFLAILKLTALLQELDPLETLQYVAFRGDGAGSFETAMLRHKMLLLREIESGHVT